MDKKIFINILIGKEEKDLLKLMDKKELKKLEKRFKRIKPTLDLLGKKECTDKDIKYFITLIENNIIQRIIDELNEIESNVDYTDKETYFYIKNERIINYIYKLERRKHEV